MSLSRVLVPVLVMAGAAAALVFLVEKELSAAWFGPGMHPEVVTLLERSMHDQKLLDETYAGADSEFRARYEEIREVVNSLRILEHSRSRIVGRYQGLLYVVLGFVVLAGAGEMPPDRVNVVLGWTSELERRIAR